MLDDLYMRVLDMSISASIVILAVMLGRLLLKKAPKVFSYMLWAVVLIRLLCPVSLEAPVSVVPEITPVSQGYTLSEEPISVVGAGVAAYQAIGDAMNGGLGVQHIPTTEKTDDGMIRYVTSDWWDVWILFGQYVWLLGVAAMVLYSAVSYLKIRRQLRVAVPLRDNILLADDIKSPFVIGFFRPKIYLPCNLGQKEQEYILLHEQYHIKRLDHIVKALAFFALTLHWFNPLVWVAFILAGKDMEMSCDEAVIRKMGEEVRADYSASLLTLATGRRIIAGTPLAFGEGDTKGRIRNLANWKRPAFWVIVIAVVLCIVLAVCLLTSRGTGNAEHVGVTWYYGTVTEQGTDSIQQRPYISVNCNDGIERKFWYNGDNTDISDTLTGEHVAVQARVEEPSGLAMAFTVEATENIRAESLDEAISKALSTYYWSERYEGMISCADYVTLANEAGGPAAANKTDTVTVYGIACHRVFALEDGALAEEGGSNVPTVLTFHVSDDGRYILAQYWEPRDGSYYADDIRTKFPLFVWPDTQEYAVEQTLACYGQAMEGFGVSVDVVINTIVEDICTRERWSGSFDELMEMCKNQRKMLVHYGQDTLRYCFSEFLEGGENGLRQQVMSVACKEIMKEWGEPVFGEELWGQEWFDAFADNALFLERKFGDFTVREDYPATWVYIQLGRALEETPDWGITLSVKNVTPTGLTIVCTQSGGAPSGELMTGTPFVVQILEDGQWMNVDPIMDEIWWNDLGWLITMNGSVAWEANWAYVYGSLAPGYYRIGKTVSNYRAAGDYDDAVYYAEFTIE